MAENLYVVESDEAIIDKIASDLAACDLHPNTRLTLVESYVGEGEDPRLEFTSVQHGEEMGSDGFDEVTVSVPMGCLKRNAVEFLPR